MPASPARTCCSASGVGFSGRKYERPPAALVLQTREARRGGLPQIASRSAAMSFESLPSVADLRGQEAIADHHAAGLEERLALASVGIGNHLDGRHDQHAVALPRGACSSLPASAAVVLEDVVGQPVAVVQRVLQRVVMLLRADRLADVVLWPRNRKATGQTWRPPVSIRLSRLV